VKCTVCKKAETESSFVTVTFDKEDSTIVFKNVPADVCQNCGEEYLSEEVTQVLLKKATEAAQSGVQVEVRKFSAA
jgi:YgiT-type zinc finger domain-containing protein